MRVLSEEDEEDRSWPDTEEDTDGIETIPLIEEAYSQFLEFGVSPVAPAEKATSSLHQSQTKNTGYGDWSRQYTVERHAIGPRIRRYALQVSGGRNAAPEEVASCGPSAEGGSSPSHGNASSEQGGQSTARHFVDAASRAAMTAIGKEPVPEVRGRLRKPRPEEFRWKARGNFAAPSGHFPALAAVMPHVVKKKEPVREIEADEQEGFSFARWREQRKQAKSRDTTLTCQMRGELAVSCSGTVDEFGGKQLPPFKAGPARPRLLERCMAPLEVPGVTVPALGEHVGKPLMILSTPLRQHNRSGGMEVDDDDGSPSRRRLALGFSQGGKAMAMAVSVQQAGLSSPRSQSPTRIPIPPTTPSDRRPSVRGRTSPPESRCGSPRSRKPGSPSAPPTSRRAAQREDSSDDFHGRAQRSRSVTTAGRQDAVEGRTVAGRRKPPRRGHTQAAGTPSERDHTGTGALWKLRHSATKEDRMASLSAARKRNRQEDRHRDKITSAEGMEHAKACFGRYFPTQPDGSLGGPCSRELLLEALADFGIALRNVEEKLAFNEVLRLWQDGTMFGLQDFCLVVEDVRVKQRLTGHNHLFQAWRAIDPDGVGLSKKHIWELLKKLDLIPSDIVALSVVEGYVDELRLDSTAGVPFHEVEYLVQRVREYHICMRRRREDELKQDYRLSDITFNEFRFQLLHIHKAFQLLDEEGQGSYLMPEECVTLLAQLGCMVGGATTEARQRREDMKAQMVSAFGGKRIAFDDFLTILRMLRKIEMGDRNETVRTVFRMHDQKKTGLLEVRDISAALATLDLEPTSPEEQEVIARLINECDTGGHGKLDVDAFRVFVQRVAEWRAARQHAAETEEGIAIGFTRSEALMLRKVFFDDLDSTGCGYLGSSAVEKAVKLMGWRRTSPSMIKQLIDENDEDGNGQLDFSEFLQLMSKIDAEMKSKSQRALPQQPDPNGPSRQDSSDVVDDTKRKSVKSNDSASVAEEVQVQMPAQRSNPGGASAEARKVRVDPNAKNGDPTSPSLKRRLASAQGVAQLRQERLGRA